MSDNFQQQDTDGDVIADEHSNWSNWYFKSSAASKQRCTSAKRYTDGDDNESEEKLGGARDRSESSARTVAASSQIPENTLCATKIASEDVNIGHFNAKPLRVAISFSSSLESEQARTTPKLQGIQEAGSFTHEVEAVTVKLQNLHQRVQQNRVEVLKFRDELEDMQAKVYHLKARVIATQSELREDMAHIERVRELLRKRTEKWRETVRISGDINRQSLRRKRLLENDIMYVHSDPERSVAEQTNKNDNSIEPTLCNELTAKKTSS